MSWAATTSTPRDAAYDIDGLCGWDEYGTVILNAPKKWEIVPHCFPITGKEALTTGSRAPNVAHTGSIVSFPFRWTGNP